MSEHRKSFTVKASDDTAAMLKAMNRAMLWATSRVLELDRDPGIIESISITTHGTATAEAVVVTADGEGS